MNTLIYKGVRLSCACRAPLALHSKKTISYTESFRTFGKVYLKAGRLTLVLKKLVLLHWRVSRILSEMLMCSVFRDV